MVGLYEVSEFVDDYVVDYKHRRFNQPPVEIEIVLYSAGAPAVAIVYYFDLRNLDAKIAGVHFYSG